MSSMWYIHYASRAYWSQPTRCIMWRCEKLLTICLPIHISLRQCPGRVRLPFVGRKNIWIYAWSWQGPSNPLAGRVESAAGALKMHFKVHSSRGPRRMQIEQCGCSSRDCTSILLHLTHPEGRRAQPVRFWLTFEVSDPAPPDGPRKSPKLPLEIFDRRLWNLTIFSLIFPLIWCIEGPSKSSSWHCSYAACTQSGYKNFYNPPTYKQLAKEKRAPICSAAINWFPTLMHRSCDFHFLSFVPSPLLGI